MSKKISLLLIATFVFSALFAQEKKAHEYAIKRFLLSHNKQYLVSIDIKET